MDEGMILLTVKKALLRNKYGKDRRKLFEFQLEDGLILSATKYHAFIIEGGAALEADLIKAGMKIWVDTNLTGNRLNENQRRG